MDSSCLLIATLLLVGVLAPRARADAAGAQQAKEFETQIPVKLNYLLYLPSDYGQNAEQKFPVILFLHGAGERGSDINKVKAHGPPKLLKDGRTDLPLKDFIVISPQCSPDHWWQPYEVLALLDGIMKELKQADADRVYLTGLSMGGFGTWEIATLASDRFAAIAPVCGGGNPILAPLLRTMPTWAFHGDKDKIISVQRSVEMIEALKRVRNDARLTRYPDAGHDSWTETYNNPELYRWFLQHKRRNNTISERPELKKDKNS